MPDITVTSDIGLRNWPVLNYNMLKEATGAYWDYDACHWRDRERCRRWEAWVFWKSQPLTIILCVCVLHLAFYICFELKRIPLKKHLHVSGAFLSLLKQAENLRWYGLTIIKRNSSKFCCLGQKLWSQLSCYRMKGTGCCSASKTELT